MALGNSQLNTFECDRMDISATIDTVLKPSWITFQYVSKNLSSWADETTIGQESINDLINTANELENLMNNTKSFIGKLDNFAELQREINNGK